ncbi:neuropeptide FF receptor 2-like [Pecten maximus]|uniref:neuropeptide FF receptor 2-like n=1 Tax=Pecten maximus TaxID=6579 RepID=UPI001458A2B8|nr:neuropeptide FF receptor 2-like [Pecten maximus]
MEAQWLRMLLTFNTSTNISEFLGMLDEFGLHQTRLKADTITLTLLYIPIFILGMAGNIFIALIIASNRHLRNSTNLYLSNMALADLCVSLICVPMAVGQALYRVWIYGEFMCKVTVYLQGVTVAASIYTIAVLSIDRFLAIRHPMIFRRVSNTRSAVKLITVIWGLSIAIMCPLLFMRRVDVVSVIPGEPLYLCNEVWPHSGHRQLYDLLLFAILYAVPGAIIGTSYSLIGKELWTEDKDLQRTESETSRGLGKHVMNGRKRVAKMLIALAILFAVCWLPYHIVSLYLDFHKRDIQPFLTVLPFTILLGHANSALNPVLYFYSSKSFRKYLFRFLKCKKRSAKRNFAVRYNPPNGAVEVRTTNRPRMRVISSSTLTRTRSTDSFRFSRSSNASFKSTNTGTRSRDTGNSSRDRCISREKCYFRMDTKAFNISTPGQEKKYETIKALVYAHKREILDRSLSIPTTINEESSRKESLTPGVRPQTNQQLIPQIPEVEENI